MKPLPAPEIPAELITMIADAEREVRAITGIELGAILVRDQDRRQEQRRTLGLRYGQAK